MRPDSPALHAEQFHVPKQKCKEPRFAWWNSIESPRTLSQDEKNSDVTSGKQNSLVYHKSNWDEVHIPCIGSIAVPCSTSYRISGLTSFRNIQTSPPHLQWLECRLVFHLTRWRVVWVTCGLPRECRRSSPRLDTGSHISWHLARHVEFNSSKGDEAWLFLKIDRKPNITVPTRNGCLVVRLTSRRVRIVLRSLV